MTVHHLSAPPRLPVVLARGALASLTKRGPYEGARLPDERLVLAGSRVDAGKLRAYAHVCGFPATDAGRPPPLPPSYPHVLGFPLAMRLMADRDFPFPLLGLVHTGVELTQHRALWAEDRPEISVRAEGPAPHRRGSVFQVVTEARLNGQLVWHSRSTYLCRHGGGDAGAGPTPAADAPPPAPLPVRAHWDLPSGLGRRYAAASGDRNPIHLHPLAAKLFGFPRHIAHGMWSFARCLAETVPGGEQVTARAEFKAPVLLPSTVAFGADRLTPPNAPSRVHRFELRGGTDPDRLHLTGEVTSERP
ncbi:MAG: MaoC family dehydratase [Streptomyces sp.]|uniref:MaoC family dehydratase n=1 Tax=Streptomyces sp. TaxID=1931 RepID=UPI003D6B0FAB